RSLRRASSVAGELVPVGRLPGEPVLLDGLVDAVVLSHVGGVTVTLVRDEGGVVELLVEALGPLVRCRRVTGGADDEDRVGPLRVDLLRLAGGLDRPRRAGEPLPRE